MKRRCFASKIYFVPWVEGDGAGAVDVEPPITDEVVLKSKSADDDAGKHYKIDITGQCRAHWWKYMYENKFSDIAMKVKVPAPLRNYDRQTNRRTDTKLIKTVQDTVESL